jgi:hypothetical protein
MAGLIPKFEQKYSRKADMIHADTILIKCMKLRYISCEVDWLQLVA